MVETAYDGRALPVGSMGTNAPAWLGALCLIATEGSLFAYLLFSYFYVASQRGVDWLPSTHPSLRYSLPGTIVLLASSVAVWWGEEGLKKDERRRQLVGLGLGVLLGVLFLGIQLFEWKSKHFTLSSRGYGSFFFTITGFHMLHVIVGVVALAAIWVWSWQGAFSSRRRLHVTIGGIYWHFVDAVWLAVFSSFYIVPYLL